MGKSSLAIWLLAAALVFTVSPAKADDQMTIQEIVLKRAFVIDAPPRRGEFDACPSEIGALAVFLAAQQAVKAQEVGAWEDDWMQYPTLRTALRAHRCGPLRVGEGDRVTGRIKIPAFTDPDGNSWAIAQIVLGDGSSSYLILYNTLVLTAEQFARLECQIHSTECQDT